MPKIIVHNRKPYANRQPRVWMGTMFVPLFKRFMSFDGQIFYRKKGE